MKKRIFISLFLALITVLSLSTAAFAADPTTVHVDWSGGGAINGSVDTGDSAGGFNVNADLANGNWDAVDSNNNPYSYGVDSFSSVFNGSIANGMMETGVNRLDSKISMYGAAGQKSYSGVSVSGGTADMAYRSTTNYAAMVDASYGYQLTGGHNIVANADSYVISRYINDGNGELGSFYAVGNGVATLDCMSAEASGNGVLKFGQGAGCYTDANFNASGAGGIATITGTGGSSVVFTGMGLSSGGGTLQIVADWLNNVSISDYSLTAN